MYTRKRISLLFNLYNTINVILAYVFKYLLHRNVKGFMEKCSYIRLHTLMYIYTSKIDIWHVIWQNTMTISQNYNKVYKYTAIFTKHSRDDDVVLYFLLSCMYVIYSKYTYFQTETNPKWDIKISISCNKNWKRHLTFCFLVHLGSLCSLFLSLKFGLNKHRPNRNKGWIVLK